MIPCWPLSTPACRNSSELPALNYCLSPLTYNCCRAGKLLPFSQKGALALVPYSYWPVHIHNWNDRSVTVLPVEELGLTVCRIAANCMSCMTFARKGRYINLARVDPTVLSGVTTTSSFARKQCIQLQVGDTPAICLTTVFCVESFLFNNLNHCGQRSIAGISHNQEFERIGAALCMVYGQTEMRVSLYESAFSFSTLAKPGKTFTFRFDTVLTLQ